MGNAKTPTGGSTDKLTENEVKGKVAQTEVARLVATPESELGKVVKANVMTVEVLAPDKQQTLPGDKTPDAISVYEAGEKGENTQIVYRDGKLVRPAAQKPNATLKEAQKRVDIEDSVEQKLADDKAADR